MFEFKFLVEAAVLYSTNESGCRDVLDNSRPNQKAASKLYESRRASSFAARSPDFG
jgi:hypothetical protein